MESIFYFGENSDKFLREFEDKRADYSLREIAELPISELKHLLQTLRQDHHILAERKEVCV